VTVKNAAKKTSETEGVIRPQPVEQMMSGNVASFATADISISFWALLVIIYYV
jgi:hypothetical protein